MTPELLKAVAYVFGIIVGIPVIYAALTVGRFFGRGEEKFQGVLNEVAALSSRITHVLEKHEEQLSDHGTRIAVLESWDGVTERRRTQ